MKKKDSGEFVKKYPAAIEAIVGTVAVAFLIYTMRSMLILGKTTLAHDNLLWNYPIFQFFAENIINGHFPFWNPFDHGGEPFYPLLGQVKLLEPITLLTIYLGHFINNDIVILFNWNHFIKSLIMVAGVYIVFRTLAANLFVRLSLIPILLYSSFILGSFREDFTSHFFWIPFITYFLLRIIYYKDCRWHNWLLLAGLIGLNWQSYFFTGAWIFLLFFLSGIVFFQRSLLLELFKGRMVIVKLAVTCAIIFAMALPNIVLMLERDKYVFPARMIDTTDYEGRPPQGGPVPYEIGNFSAKILDINMPYSLIAFTGTFSNIWDFIQIISPDGNEHIQWPSRNRWGQPSEAYMYIGFLPWVIAILGLVAGKHEMKMVWLLIIAGFGLLMLGPAGGLHKLLYYIYPPMWFVRHTHTFVLFFIFALLYFYVLGFNRIFSTWDRPIFESNTYDGIFHRLIGKGGVSNSIAILIFSGAIVLLVYWMTRLAYPYIDYLFIFIILIFIIGVILWKDLGEKGVYISLVISHIAIVFIFSTNTYKFIRYIVPALGFPLALFIFIKTQKGLSEVKKYYISLSLLFIFGTALTFDLTYSFKRSSFLYSTKHPSISHNINTTLQKSSSPQNRYVYPDEIVKDDNECGMRYLPIVYRQSFVFSSIKEGDYSDLEIKDTFKELTNKSFEDWEISLEGKFLPKQFEYIKEGTSGGVERYSGQDGVKDGKFSALLRPSPVGNSYIKYKTSNTREIAGQHIRVSVWIKSQNKTPGAIQLGIQEKGKKNEILKSYDNSGNWERLVVGDYIGVETSKLIITFTIKSSATAPVYIDGLEVDIVKVNNIFEYALKSKRWSSFLLLKKYFDLINMDIPPLALEEIFAVGKPMFQFKNKVVGIKENETATFLKMLGSHKSGELLKEAVLIDYQIDRSLTRFMKLSQEYQNDNQNSPAGRGVRKEKDISGEDGKNKFAYTIENYNYNSFEMKVSTDNEGILYWADGYDKNWHAYINGKEVLIYRANINFKAISLPQGASTISFVYDPFWFKAGLFVFYGTFICVMVFIILSSFITAKRYVAG